MTTNGFCGMGSSRRTLAVSTEGKHVESQIDVISSQEYKNISNEYMDSLADALEDYSEMYPQIDCELTQGVLTLQIPPIGTYVINKQPPNKQIWLSSPISGPKRYDLIGGKWITLRDSTSLTDLLEREIGEALSEESFSLDLDM